MSYMSGTPIEPHESVLIQMVSPVGHWWCLINGFASTTERMVRGIGEGEKDFVDACGGKKKREECQNHSGVDLVWDVQRRDEDS